MSDRVALWQLATISMAMAVGDDSQFTVLAMMPVSFQIAPA
jgi:hypothetical protein